MPGGPGTRTGATASYDDTERHFMMSTETATLTPNRIRKPHSFSYWIMLAPSLLLVVGIVIPFAQGIGTSFTNEKSYVRHVQFVWFDNYVQLFASSTFLTGLAVTLGYLLLVFVIQLPLSIAAALLMERSSTVQKISRSLMVLPMLVPLVVVGLIWKMMMQPQTGVIDYLLGPVGGGSLPWLTSPNSALISVILIDTWAFLPFSTLILLAGLQSLPQELHEAAHMDGAGWWARIRHISLPWLAPYLVLVMLFRTADSLKMFDLIWPVTHGGPLDSTRLLHVQVYEEAFRFSSTARAMAIVVVLWILISVISLVLLRFWRRSVNSVG